MNKNYWINQGKIELTKAGATPDQCFVWAEKLYPLNLKEVKKTVNLILFYRFMGILPKYIESL